MSTIFEASIKEFIDRSKPSALVGARKIEILQEYLIYKRETNCTLVYRGEGWEQLPLLPPPPPPWIHQCGFVSKEYQTFGGMIISFIAGVGPIKSGP